MTKFKQNTTLNHVEFSIKLRNLLEEYNLKIDSASISVKNDKTNKVVIKLLESDYIFSKDRTWHEY